jgi:hypothetical protein
MIDTNQLSALIWAFRVETEKESISPQELASLREERVVSSDPWRVKSPIQSPIHSAKFVDFLEFQPFGDCHVKKLSILLYFKQG